MIFSSWQGVLDIRYVYTCGTELEQSPNLKQSCGATNFGNFLSLTRNLSRFQTLLAGTLEMGFHVSEEHKSGRSWVS